MKRKLKVAPKPNQLEAAKLEKYIWMADWHFEETIKKMCTQISSDSIYRDNDKADPHWVYAVVYGLEAMKLDTKESCIGNIFIRYKSRVYQTTGVTNSAEIIRLIRKEAAFDEYQTKLWRQQWREREKVIAANRKEKAKVKKLRVVLKKKVA